MSWNSSNPSPDSDFRIPQLTFALSKGFAPGAIDLTGVMSLSPRRTSSRGLLKVGGAFEVIGVAGTLDGDRGSGALNVVQVAG
jgi:hypothetical protein